MVRAQHGQLRDAILDAAAELVIERGVTAVAMSHVAERTGITRATLYKYFPDVREILNAWHERQVAANLDELAIAHDAEATPGDRLAGVLDAYARMVYEQHSSELVALLHDSEHAVRGYDRLAKMLRDVIAEGARAGSFRRDVPPAELASFCTNALAAAHGVGSMAAVRRLVRVTLAAVAATD
jgi:AcrR family transcriptional regulator